MPEPWAFVIFGSTGHLARTKLLPALFHLHCGGRLPNNLSIIGFGRRAWSDAEWREQVAASLRTKVVSSTELGAIDAFCARLRFHPGDLDDFESAGKLRDALLERGGPSIHCAFYLSLPPSQYQPAAEFLASAGLHDDADGRRRLVVEKPFGIDLESAQQLDTALHRHFREDQIFRIDHYLGKETVQNIFVFRFANLMLEPLWNRNCIDHVQITHSEMAGIDDRADYYETAGALRDMIQSHLLQMLALTAMEPPANFDSDSIRDEKVKVLKSIRAIEPADVMSHACRAQYAAGVADRKVVKGYLEEEGVAPGSATETFAALKLYIDNWRWRNVPFYLRTGKRLAKNGSLIAIRFKHAPQQLFRAHRAEELSPNWLLMGIQPAQCIRIELQVREPGIGVRTRTTQMDASSCTVPDYRMEAYQALLVDVIGGDHSQFLRSDEVQWAWRIVDPVLRAWKQDTTPIPTYPAGTWGPREVDQLFERPDQHWRHTFDEEAG